MIVRMTTKIDKGNKKSFPRREEEDDDLEEQKRRKMEETSVSYFFFLAHFAKISKMAFKINHHAIIYLIIPFFFDILFYLHESAHRQRHKGIQELGRRCTEAGIPHHNDYTSKGPIGNYSVARGPSRLKGQQHHTRTHSFAK